LYRWCHKVGEGEYVNQVIRVVVGYGIRQILIIKNLNTQCLVQLRLYIKFLYIELG